MNQSSVNSFCNDIQGVQKKSFFSQNKKEFQEVVNKADALKMQYTIEGLNYGQKRQIVTKAKRDFKDACEEYLKKNKNPLTKQDKQRVELIKGILAPKKQKIKSTFYQYHSISEKYWMKDKTTWEKIKDKFSIKKKSASRNPVNIEDLTKTITSPQKNTKIERNINRNINANMNMNNAPVRRPLGRK